MDEGTPKLLDNRRSNVQWTDLSGRAFTARDYHRPSDEYTADFDLAGTVQHAEGVRALAAAAANVDTAPTWNVGVEYAARRAPRCAPVP